MKLEILQDTGRTPLIFGEVSCFGEEQKSDKTIIFYGHFDKQPPMLPWDEGLGPYSPVIRDGKLYGRGASDDG